jgi:alpha-L-fucosidase
MNARLTRFAGSHEQDALPLALADDSPAVLTASFAGAQWEIAAVLEPVADRTDAVDGRVTFGVTGGAACEVAVAAEWALPDWSRDVFVMLPAAAYNGNRYPNRPYKYPPMVHEPGDIGPEAPTLVSDVPRLSHADVAPSRLQLLTGDLTTPAAGFFNPRTGQAAILLTDQGSALGNHGLTVEENADRTRAVLRLEAPGVRRDTLYTMVNTATPSWDRGVDWRTGDAVTLRFRLYRFPAADVQALYDRFALVRKDLTGPVTLKHGLPLSAAFAITEAKHQRENWCEEGYYRVGTHDAAATCKYQDWQLGWVGGGMTPVAFLMVGQAESRPRALRNLDWMFSRAQLPSGLFYAVYSKGVPCGDGFGLPGTDRWYMVRKQADALYFLLKTFHVLRAQEAGWRLPAPWAAGTRLLTDRFVDTFRRFGQLGQYLDCETGDVVVGGSTAAAMAPGALALAGQYFAYPAYTEVAEAAARQLDERDVRAGITTGGPGEILKCADSESAFAMLESFVVLYEVTGKAHWLARAEAMAAQCLTWCASYDYAFPPDSPFGRLDMRAAGSVWANVQNKHSAPGICTLSGDALFKLFRYTGNRLWLEQIQETAHNLTQYLSRADRPVGTPPAMRPGCMCERVNFSDWEGRGNIGGSLFGSCWPEVSLLLTAAELPGIYAQPDTRLLCVFDHIEACWTEAGGAAALECRNPTAFDATVRVFAESSAGARTILGQAAAVRWPVLDVPAGATRVLALGESARRVAGDAGRRPGKAGPGGRGDWFKQAQFGMFVHWGLYALPAGEWRGQRMADIGEWIQAYFRIPNAEYGKLAGAFNPVCFDPREWVQVAKDAGMKYLVFTAKHADGFAMFHSRVDPFNIVDATPFGRDVTAELAEACRAEGVRFGLYYSQDIDLRHPHGGGYRSGHTAFNGKCSWTNDWDFPDNARKDYSICFREKILPQVEELLTGYGKLSLFWCDNPATISPEQSAVLYRAIRRHQPDCLINSRLGHGVCDYRSLGDNQIADEFCPEELVESPATLNDTWGYKAFDQNWKSAAEVLRIKQHLAERGINYLLNVGPDHLGRFPAPAVEILKKVGGQG